jgi:hypothetical protein
MLRLRRSQQMTTEAIEFDLRECLDAALQTVAEQAAIKSIELCYATASSYDPESKLIGDEFASRVLQKPHSYAHASFSGASRSCSISCESRLENASEVFDTDLSPSDPMPFASPQ